MLVGGRLHLVKAFGIVLLVCLTGACAPEPEEPETTSDGPAASRPSGPLRLGVVTWVGSGPFYLAQERGLFGDLDVEISIIDDAAGRRAALARGSIDAMLATVDDFANAAAAGLPGVAILKTDDSMGGDGLVASRDIESVADLSGRTVAFPQGMPSHFFLAHLLQAHGVESDSIERRYMEAGEAGAAFVAQRVDAAVTWEPWLSQATEREGGHVLATTRDYPGLIADIVVANRSSFAERRADFRTFLEGWFAALEAWKADEEAANALMAASLGLELADFEAMLGGIRYADIEENRQYFGIGSQDKAPVEEVFDSAMSIWAAEGLVTTEASFGEHFDPSLLSEID